MDNILATGISYSPHLVAFDQVVKQRLEGIDLTPLLMYIIDTTDADALPFLAEQFHVLGWEGWALAQNDSERRTLIKRAIELHKYKGTIWAIKNALTAVGFAGAQVIEHVGFDYNGQATHNGSNTYSGGNWATFRVKLEIPPNKSVTVSERAAIVAMILEYKNVRSHLVDISFVVNLQDEVTYSELLDLLSGGTDTETIFAGAYYDGAYNYAGTVNHNKGDDPAEITITINGISQPTEQF